MQLTAAFVLLSALSLVFGDDQCNAYGPRKDCGYGGITPDKCEANGCCYIPAAPTTGAAFMTLPACFHKNAGDSSYALQGGLQPSGNAMTGTLTQQASTQQELGRDISPLTVTVQYLTGSIMRAKIGAAGRWEVPMDLFNATLPQGSATPPADAAYSFNYSQSPFGFNVSRSGAGAGSAPLFSTMGSRLIFKDQYLEVTTPVPAEDVLFGAGEHISATGLELRRDGAPLTLWTRDCAAADPDQNTYGSWPFVLGVRPGGEAYGVLLLNSNGQDIVATNSSLSWRAIGGVLDFFFFLGPTPMAVLEQLTSVVGRPMMVPYWSLGLMNSKYGYSSLKQLNRVVDSYAYAKIPLETFVTDSQYMNHDQDFTLGVEFNASSFQSFVAKLNGANQRWVPILDPPIHVSPGYPAYDSGIAADVFLKDITGRPFVGQMWPGVTYWPDFMHSQTDAWWQNQVNSVDKLMPLDGIWLDMNEISNYCSGDVCSDPGNVPAASDFVCKVPCQWGPNAMANITGPRRQLPEGIYSPPFLINNANNQMNLSIKTLAVTVAHADGTLEYDAHNLYGMYEVKSTAQALRSIRGRRHFILTRSSFVGTGAYAAHWTGDSASTWWDLRWQVTAVLAPGLVGISFSGADICGFQNIATEELCARWIAVGAWQPFTRVHHAQSFQELYRWPQVADVARKVLGWRLRLMPYLYSAFYDSHALGCPVARPLFFNFPSDPATLRLREQWMMGDALLISPILRRGANSTQAYFPPGLWYSLYDDSVVNTTSGGRNVTVRAGVTDNTPIHVLGGNVLPVGQPGSMTTTAARASPLTLLVALAPVNGSSAQRCGGACSVPQGATMAACGHMYLDGGDELEVGTAADNLLAFDAATSPGANGTQGQVRLSWPGKAGGNACTASTQWPALEGMHVLGVSGVDPATLTMQVSGSGPAAGGLQNVAANLVNFDAASSRLAVSGLNHTLACAQDIVFSWSSPSPVPAG